MTENPSDRPTIIFRAAVTADVPAIASLRGAFWADQISKGSIDHPDMEPAQILLDSGSLIARARTIVLLATDHSNIVGYILGQTRSLPGVVGTKISSIEEIFVEPSYRHFSVARHLVERALAEFQIAGAQRVQLRILNSNYDGKSFWQRIGFSPSVTIYEYLNSGNPTNC